MKIVLSGFYGAGNTGDEAILEAIIDNLREHLNSPEITVFSLSPQETAKKYQVDSIHRSWKRDNRKKWKALKSADLLISGGGGLLQDTYPTKIISGPLPYYLLIVFLAKLAGCKVMFFSQGIGPVNTKYGKWLMRRFANLADLITVRDEHSKELLKILSVTKPPAYVTADIVFAYKKKEDTSCFDDLPQEWIDRKDRLISVSVRPWFGNQDYLKKIADGLDYIIEEMHLYPVFVPMEGLHDVKTSKQVIQLMENKEDCFVLDHSYTPNQYLNFISGTRLTIGMRLHSLIFATIGNVPHIGISYDPKVKSLLKRNGLWPFSFDLENVNSKELFKNVQTILSKEEAIKENLAAEAEKLYKDAVRNINLLKDYFIMNETLED